MEKHNYASYDLHPFAGFFFPHDANFYDDIELKTFTHRILVQRKLLNGYWTSIDRTSSIEIQLRYFVGM